MRKMGNPFYGGIGNLGMRPMGQPTTVPQVNVPNFTPQPVSRAYSSYVVPQQTTAPVVSSVMPGSSTMNAIQSITPQSNMIWIDSPDEITNYPSGRGWQQWFGNKNEPIVYIRETDSNGVIQPIVTVWLDFKGPGTTEQQNANNQVTAAEPVPDTKVASAPVSASASASGTPPTREEFNTLAAATKQTNSDVASLVKAIGPVIGKLDEFLKS